MRRLIYRLRHCWAAFWHPRMAALRAQAQATAALKASGDQLALRQQERSLAATEMRDSEERTAFWKQQHAHSQADLAAEQQRTRIVEAELAVAKVQVDGLSKVVNKFLEQQDCEARSYAIRNQGPAANADNILGRLAD